LTDIISKGPFVDYLCSWNRQSVMSSWINPFNHQPACRQAGDHKGNLKARPADAGRTGNTKERRGFV